MAKVAKQFTSQSLVLQKLHWGNGQKYGYRWLQGLTDRHTARGLAGSRRRQKAESWRPKELVKAAVDLLVLF